MLIPILLTIKIPIDHDKMNHMDGNLHAINCKKTLQSMQIPFDNLMEDLEIIQ